MARLIDIEAPYKIEIELDGGKCHATVTAPTVDAEPVVRCKDCKHKGWIQEPCHGKSVDYCRQLERPVDEQFFCGLGKHKGGDE